jgi:alpha-glucosidase
MKVFATVLAAAFAAAAGTAFAAQVTVASPDGYAAIRIEDDASRFSVQWRGETVVAASPLGLELDGAPAFGTLALESREDNAAFPARLIGLLVRCCSCSCNACSTGAGLERK